MRTDALNQYITERQAEGASNASINRELAALKRAFKLGMIAGKVAKIPIFPHLRERNIRQGFLEDAAYTLHPTSEGLCQRRAVASCDV